MKLTKYFMDRNHDSGYFIATVDAYLKFFRVFLADGREILEKRCSSLFSVEWEMIFWKQMYQLFTDW